MGDVLICTAFLSYSGPFNQEYRHIMRKIWEHDLDQRKIPYTDELNVTGMMIDEATVTEIFIKFFYFTSKCKKILSLVNCCGDV